MAREIGIEPAHSQTIANGTDYCDFRWKFPSPGERSQKPEQLYNISKDSPRFLEDEKRGLFPITRWVSLYIGFAGIEFSQ